MGYTTALRISAVTAAHRTALYVEHCRSVLRTRVGVVPHWTACGSPVVQRMARARARQVNPPTRTHARAHTHAHARAHPPISASGDRHERWCCARLRCIAHAPFARTVFTAHSEHVVAPAADVCGAAQRHAARPMGRQVHTGKARHWSHAHMHTPKLQCTQAHDPTQPYPTAHARARTHARTHTRARTHTLTHARTDLAGRTAQAARVEHVRPNKLQRQWPNRTDSVSACATAFAAATAAHWSIGRYIEL